jgi:hypothetical protein
MMNSLSELLVTTAKFAARVLAVGCVSLLAISSTLAADDSEFSLSLGVFITDRNSTTRLDASVGTPGTPVDLEKELGLDKSDTVFRLDGYYRFNDKHRIDFSAFDLSRTSSKAIDTEIDWGGTTYPINTTLAGEFDLKVYKLAYTYSIMRREKGYLGLTGGLYVADIGTRLSAEGVGATEGGGITAPLPVVGLRGEYRLSEKWTFRAGGELFALEYDAFDGSLVDLYAGVDYQLFDHAALGFGLNSVRIDVGVEDADLTGNIDWRYDGGLVFVKVNF